MAVVQPVRRIGHQPNDAKAPARFDQLRLETVARVGADLARDTVEIGDRQRAEPGNRYVDGALLVVAADQGGGELVSYFFCIIASAAALSAVRLPLWVQSMSTPAILTTVTGFWPDKPIT